MATSTGDLVRQYSAQDLFRQHSAQGLFQKYLKTHQEEDRFHHHQCLQKIFQNKLDLMLQLPTTRFRIQAWEGGFIESLNQFDGLKKKLLINKKQILLINKKQIDDECFSLQTNSN